MGFCVAARAFVLCAGALRQRACVTTPRLAPEVRVMTVLLSSCERDSSTLPPSPPPSPS
jgi:hypothetical protein